MAGRVGDLPQNVNFAIRGEVMRLFLENNRVNFALSRNAARLENTGIGARRAVVTVRVRCIRNPAPIAAGQL